MTDRFEEMAKFSAALTNVNHVVADIDTSVLNELDKRVLEEYINFGETYAKYVIVLLLEKNIQSLKGVNFFGEVKE